LWGKDLELHQGKVIKKPIEGGASGEETMAASFSQIKHLERVRKEMPKDKRGIRKITLGEK